MIRGVRLRDLMMFSCGEREIYRPYHGEAMIFLTGAILLIFTLCLSGCSTKKPEIWMAQDVALSNFKAFEIQPVFNGSGRPVKQDILVFLTAYLKEEFRGQSLQLSDTPQTKSGVLLVQTDILDYEASKPSGIGFSNMGGSGASRVFKCTLRTRLVEKSTNKVVAAILTVKEIGMGAIGYETNEWFLKESAAAVAKEVAKMMQPIETKGYSQEN